MSRENEEIRNTREKCTSCCYWDQEDHCCWNLWSLKYRTEVGKLKVFLKRLKSSWRRGRKKIRKKIKPALNNAPKNHYE